MKHIKLALLLTAGFLFLGCNLGDDAISKLLIKNAARGVGYEVGKANEPSVEAAIEEAYSLIQSGQYDEVRLTEALLKLKKMHPLLMATCLDALGVMGASVNGDAVIDMTGISPAAWAAAETGYRQGVLIGKAEGK